MSASTFPPTPEDVVTVRLIEQMRLKLKEAIPEHELLELRSYGFSSYHSDLLAAMVVEVQRALYGREIHRQVMESEHVPADWWQHFKQRWFPRWAIRRWPTKTREIVKVVKLCRVCPHLDVPRGAREHVLFLLDKRIPNLEARE